jgi:hypothetical protein
MICIFEIVAGIDEFDVFADFQRNSDQARVAVG